VWGYPWTPLIFAKHMALKKVLGPLTKNWVPHDVRDIGDFAIQRLEPVDIGKKYNLSRERLTCAFSRSTCSCLPLSDSGKGSQRQWP
jgi:hypothetical protein